jgi:excisionase family DNA binding protein
MKQLNWLLASFSNLVISSIFSYCTYVHYRDRAMTDEILTIQEVATYLKLNEKTAYRLASEGKLPGFKVGGSWRFKRVDLEKWIEEQKQ